MALLLIEDFSGQLPDFAVVNEPAGRPFGNEFEGRPHARRRPLCAVGGKN
jgi:hypothetical protein